MKIASDKNKKFLDKNSRWKAKFRFFYFFLCSIFFLSSCMGTDLSQSRKNARMTNVDGIDIYFQQNEWYHSSPKESSEETTALLKKRLQYKIKKQLMIPSDSKNHSDSIKKSNEIIIPPNVQAILSSARKLIGSRYKFAGSSPQEGFDCSGLTQYVFSLHNISLPRSAEEQFRKSKPVSPELARRGDLVFFDINGKGISHVGIYTGKMKFIHAPSSGKKVKEVSLNTLYWQERFRGVHRVLANES